MGGGDDINRKRGKHEVKKLGAYPMKALEIQRARPVVSLVGDENKRGRKKRKSHLGLKEY